MRRLQSDEFCAYFRNGDTLHRARRTLRLPSADSFASQKLFRAFNFGIAPDTRPPRSRIEQLLLRFNEFVQELILSAIVFSTGVE